MGAAPRADALAALSGGSTWLSILISCHPNPPPLQFKAGRPCPREQGRKRVPQGAGGTPQAPSNAGAAQEALGVQPCTVGGWTVAEPRVTFEGPLQAASIHRHLNGPPRFPLLASSTPSGLWKEQELSLTVWACPLGHPLRGPDHQSLPGA